MCKLWRIDLEATRLQIQVIDRDIKSNEEGDSHAAGRVDRHGVLPGGNGV